MRPEKMSETERHEIEVPEAARHEVEVRHTGELERPEQYQEVDVRHRGEEANLRRAPCSSHDLRPPSGECLRALRTIPGRFRVSANSNSMIFRGARTPVFLSA